MIKAFFNVILVIFVRIIVTKDPFILGEISSGNYRRTIGYLWERIIHLF
jgi:hypothetical protein